VPGGDDGPPTDSDRTAGSSSGPIRALPSMFVRFSSRLSGRGGRRPTPDTAVRAAVQHARSVPEQPPRLFALDLQTIAPPRPFQVRTRAGGRIRTDEPTAYRAACAPRTSGLPARTVPGRTYPMADRC